VRGLGAAQFFLADTRQICWSTLPGFAASLGIGLFFSELRTPAARSDIHSSRAAAHSIINYLSLLTFLTHWVYAGNQ